MSVLAFPSSANPAQHFAANRGSPSARGAELCRICQGDPQRAFSEILQSWDKGKLLLTEGQKKHPGANTIMSSLKFPSNANLAQHFAANRGSPSARGAKLCRTCQGDPSARFLKFCKVGTRGNSCKEKARKNTLARMPSCPRYNFLKVPTSHNILLQTAAPQVPAQPSYVEFAKGTPSARFLKFCKVGTRENSCKNKAKKKSPWRECHHVLASISLKCQPRTTFCYKPRLPKCP